MEDSFRMTKATSLILSNPLPAGMEGWLTPDIVWGETGWVISQ
jgi:hypothetical protein